VISNFSARVISQKIFNSIDRMIICYIGLSLEKDKLRACQVENTGSKVVIRGTGFFRRHLMTDSISTFMKENYQTLSKSQKEKLGKAVGKSIAEDLTVSFNESRELK
jgi:hypothetical protein|tara:strand:- start:113 stop:433 length:321 start_codon:yes stop_codon:yes gene_type:complete